MFSKNYIYLKYSILLDTYNSPSSAKLKKPDWVTIR